MGAVGITGHDWEANFALVEHTHTPKESERVLITFSHSVNASPDKGHGAHSSVPLMFL